MLNREGTKGAKVRREEDRKRRKQNVRDMEAPST